MTLSLLYHSMIVSLLGMEFSCGGSLPHSHFPVDGCNPISTWGGQGQSRRILTIWLRQGSHCDHSLHGLILQSIGNGEPSVCIGSELK